MTQERSRRDLRAELDEDEGDRAGAWRPEVGDVLVGELVRFEECETQYALRRIAVIRDDEGGELRALWLVHRALEARFEELAPQPGDRLGVKRLPDSPKGARRYVVKLDRATDRAQPDEPRPGGDAPERERGNGREPRSPF